MPMTPMTLPRLSRTGSFVQRNPAQVPLLVIPDFEAVDERFAAADDFLVVVAIRLRDIRREEFLIHRTDELALALDAESLKGGAVRRDVPPLVVLHEKEHAGHVLENRPHALRIGDPGEKVGLETWQRHGRILTKIGSLSPKEPRVAKSIDRDLFSAPS